MCNSFYQNYHKHTSFSHRYNKDSPLTHMDYFKEYVKLANKGADKMNKPIGNYVTIDFTNEKKGIEKGTCPKRQNSLSDYPDYVQL